LPRKILRRALGRVNGLDPGLNLQVLAAESGYSRSHFLRMFQAATGDTPHRYLLHLRLQRAQELMRQQHEPLMDIAVTCGFSSHAHVFRVFRRLLGVTLASIDAFDSTFLQSSHDHASFLPNRRVEKDYAEALGQKLSLPSGWTLPLRYRSHP
jgi:AraC-like DNA-binding protein